MSLKPRLRKQHHREDMKGDPLVQVHKPAKREISSDRETLRTEASEESSGSNKTYIKDDYKNDNCSIHNTPSRDVSVDGESQINTKILNLIESEIKREVKHSTFSDSRPQSLSFYEEEKMPEELSGNLELLSPEERKHYKRRKDYGPIDNDERNLYNNLQDNDDILMSGVLKKSKSRKKKHGDGDLGMGDSREMMIPKEKRKSKKKKHELSPMSSSKRNKHKKRDEDYEPRNEITMALEELQDDVFENNIDEYQTRHEKSRKSPRRSDKLYVQKKNKFELTSRDVAQMETHPIRQKLNANNNKKKDDSPVAAAIGVQQFWRKMSMFCHGLLGGLAFAHLCYICSNHFSTDPSTLLNYAAYSDIYIILFGILCTLCLVSVFDKYDFAHLTIYNLKDLIHERKSSFVIILYLATLIIHFATAPHDDMISQLADDVDYAMNITSNDLRLWNSLSFSRAFFAFLGWFFVSLASPDDYLLMHLQTIESYGLAEVHIVD